jgi:opioid growth factor receptor-like protein
MSRLLNFYRGLGTDIEGRRLEEILAWPDDDLEEVHDFIQWLFPLPEPSQFNPDAPLLTKEDIAAFKSDPVLQANLMKSFERIVAFLGLALSEGKVVNGPNFKARLADVWTSPNHNWLRISRILRSLTLLGMAAQAQALYEWMEATYTSRKFPISAETFRYWTQAVKE